MTAPPFKTIVLNLLQQGHLAEEAFLQEALTLAPRLKERAKSDPELLALRDQLA